MVFFENMSEYLFFSSFKCLLGTLYYRGKKDFFLNKDISVMTVVKFHSVSNEIQYTFASKWAFLKDFLIFCKENLIGCSHKMGIFSFQSNFFGQKINLIILKMIFVLEYQTRRTTFSNNIFSFIHIHEILFSKSVPYFCRLSTNLSCQLLKKPLRMFIWM